MRATGIWRGSAARGRRSRSDRDQPNASVPKCTSSRGVVDLPAVKAALSAASRNCSRDYPGVGVEDVGAKLRLVIPEALRVGHEAALRRGDTAVPGLPSDPAALPAWEKANMLAKYHVTTHGVRMAQGRFRLRG